MAKIQPSLEYPGASPVGDRPSEDVFICLFDGAFHTVDISLKPEELYFGFNGAVNT